ncbi:MAG: TBC domain-containing protein [Candidatus Pacebacteria bacterium]|nr:TBC domain-containing protein [Candidatus Paceibacterota bacterium]
MRPDVGYAQGMNYYAGMLLLNCKNVESFEIMSYLLTVPIVMACFTANMQKLTTYGQIFEEVLASSAPKLQKHLESCEYQYVTYIFDVVASMFCANFPYITARKIWDYILPKPEVGIFRVGLAVFKTLEEKILDKSAPEEIMMIVKSPCEHADEETILQNISKTEVSAETYYKIKEKKMAAAGITT